MVGGRWQVVVRLMRSYVEAECRAAVGASPSSAALPMHSVVYGAHLGKCACVEAGTRHALLSPWQRCRQTSPHHTLREMGSTLRVEAPPCHTNSGSMCSVCNHTFLHHMQQAALLDEASWRCSAECIVKIINGAARADTLQRVPLAGKVDTGVSDAGHRRATAAGCIPT